GRRGALVAGNGAHTAGGEQGRRVNRSVVLVQVVVAVHVDDGRVDLAHRLVDEADGGFGTADLGVDQVCEDESGTEQLRRHEGFILPRVHVPLAPATGHDQEVDVVTGGLVRRQDPADSDLDVARVCTDRQHLF